MTLVIEEKFTICDAPLSSILLNVVSGILNVVYRLVLLRDQGAHLGRRVRGEPWGVVRESPHH